MSKPKPKWIDKLTGLPMTRTDIVEAFEAEIGRPVTAGEYQTLLSELERQEAQDG